MAQAAPASPFPYQQVEIFVDGEWRPATFHPCDFVAGDDDNEEVWWNDFFCCTPSGAIYPEDVQDHNAELPQWRPIKGTV